ncbi:hypothetical protein GO755_34825 [Spirosoma sp. HMF4905]|uniref:Bacterial toxin 44 domain-containing protein n=1 Tax=Spirosoma arboris TaxID=2682092 RepID=A0A7K1SN70_9BACT|nr:polymorphic toxin type 44 domain-containing protein [Spirosoma arboris]MVM35248.1 hypothetical protein [Spirosoma arboris]
MKKLYESTPHQRRVTLTIVLIFVAIISTWAQCSVSSPNGSMDYANCDGVGGWAFDGANLNQPITVDIYVDGTKTYSGITANGDRQDLVGAFGNAAARYHGFNYSFPANASWKNGQPHTISVRICGTSNDIGGSPMTVSGCSGGSQPTNPPTGTCNYTEGQYLFTTAWGESVYAHFYNGSLFAAYQDGSNFKPQHWLAATGQMDQNTANCFVENDPHNGGSTNPPSNPNIVPIPPASGNFAGNFDYADCSVISGWVMNLNKPNQSTRVDVYVNGWLVATNVMAVQGRQDVANAYGIGGNKAFGFNIPLPKGYHKGVALTIAVKYAGTSTNIPGSPKTTTVCEQYQTQGDANPDCNTGIARILPGSGKTLSATLARTGTYSLKLNANSAGRPSALTSQLISVKQGDLFTLDAYASVLAPSERNLKPQLTKAVMGGVLTGLVLTKNQSNQPDQHRLAEVLPTLGVSSALMLPLIKSLLTSRWPNATLELAFYDKQGHFESRQQVGLPKTAYGDWQLLHIEGRATQDGYVKFRLQNHNKIPVYLDDITFQAKTVSPTNELIAEAVARKWSSTGGFPASVSTAPEEIYRTGDPCETGGGGDYGTIVDQWYRDPLNGNLLLEVDVRATAPTYSLSPTGGIIYIDAQGNAFPATAGANGNPGGNDLADMTFLFNQQLEQTKIHFCQQAAAIRAGYPTPPNWAAPGDPQSGEVAALLHAFVNDVRNNAPYDLKTHGYAASDIGTVSAYNGSVYRYDDYGNINFGIAAAASGIPLSVAVCGAGIYQFVPGSGPVDFGNLGGCGDDRQDSAMIRMGYQMFIGCDSAVRTDNREQN